MTRISRQIRKQKNRNPKGYRHKDEVIENYALIAWIIGGRRHYEILYENFKPAFPSPSSLHTKLQKYYTVLHEGQRNLAVLKKSFVGQQSAAYRFNRGRRYKGCWEARVQQTIKFNCGM
jgi:hypothetical protein